MIVHTIGHSNHGWDAFRALLREHRVRVLVDVRSRPRSRFAHFTGPRLAEALAEAGIAYVPAGEGLGGRPADPTLYPESPAPGRGGTPLPDYDRMRSWPPYRDALARIAERIAAAPEGAVCLMCAEEDPARCHRGLLIAPDLEARGIVVRHIRRPGAGRLEGRQMSLF